MIGDCSTAEFQAMVRGFSRRYVLDWERWLATPGERRPAALGKILRAWQACRPNAMRRARGEAKAVEHPAPHLDDLIAAAAPHVDVLSGFDLRSAASYTPQTSDALTALWHLLVDLSYRGGPRDGRAGCVGISKAVLLLTDGRVGPAMDRCVRHALRVEVVDPVAWIAALQRCTADIAAWEARSAMPVHRAVPEFGHLQSGRIYDMALGPRQPEPK